MRRRGRLFKVCKWAATLLSVALLAVIAVTHFWHFWVEMDVGTSTCAVALYDGRLGMCQRDIQTMPQWSWPAFYVESSDMSPLGPIFHRDDYLIVWSEFQDLFSLPLRPLLLAAFASAALMWCWPMHRPPPGHCPQCRYNLTGNVSGICPECGSPMRDAK